MPGGGVLQVEARSGFQKYFCLFRIAKMGFNHAEVVLNLGGVRVRKFFKSLFGFKPVTGLEIGAAKLPVNAGRTVGGGGELPEQLDRLRRLLGFEICSREIVPGRSVAGIEFQRLLKGCDGSFDVAGLQAAGTEKIPRLRGGYARFERLLKANGGASKVVVFEIRQTGLEIFRGRPATSSRAGNGDND